MRRPTTRNLGAAALLTALVLTGCSTGNGDQGGDGASAAASSPATLATAPAPPPTRRPPRWPRRSHPSRRRRPRSRRRCRRPPSCRPPSCRPPSLRPRSRSRRPRSRSRRRRRSRPDSSSLHPSPSSSLRSARPTATRRGRCSNACSSSASGCSGVDGEYGMTTRQAVMAFQKYSLLPPTGAVDQATADAINATPYRGHGITHRGRPDRDRQDQAAAVHHPSAAGRSGSSTPRPATGAVRGGGQEHARRDGRPACRSPRTGCGRSTASVPKAGGRVISARSTDPSTSAAASPCTGRTASRTTRRRTVACASACRRWT